MKSGVRRALRRRRWGRSVGSGRRVKSAHRRRIVPIEGVAQGRGRDLHDSTTREWRKWAAVAIQACTLSSLFPFEGGVGLESFEFGRREDRKILTPWGWNMKRMVDEERREVAIKVHVRGFPAKASLTMTTASSTTKEIIGNQFRVPSMTSTSFIEAKGRLQDEGVRSPSVEVISQPLVALLVHGGYSINMIPHIGIHLENFLTMPHDDAGTAILP